MVSKTKKSKRQLSDVLECLCSYIPNVGGSVNVEIDNDKQIYNVQIPPSMFMACYHASDPEVVVKKRDFWDDKSVIYIVSIDTGDMHIYTYLNRTLPRDAKYLDERR